MTSRSTKTSRLPLYPAFCYNASPTYHAWAKLTAANVHALRREPGYEGQNVYFHLNHPIRFVRVVGTVVAIDDTHAKISILTLDDGSGATIEVKINRLPAEIASSIDCPSNTDVENVNVTPGLGAFAVLVDGIELDIGTVISVKCTISTFRGAKQLELKRVSVVRTTNDEIKAWADLATFAREILSKPWVLDAQRLKELKDKARAEAKEEREYKAKKGEHEKMKRAKLREWEARMRKYEERGEMKRRKEDVMMNAGALKGTDAITYPAYIDR